MDHPARVRECAAALKAAVADARAAGYRVDGIGNLDGIGVSETAKTVSQLVVEVSTDPPKISPVRKASAPNTPKE